MPAITKQLNVKRENQHDNASGEGYRECFSSTCGAIARFWGKVSGDDEYNRLRRQHGDTTSIQAQLLTLRSLGLRANFRDNCSQIDLINEISAGRPVAVGWFHAGPLPDGLRGSGHWSVVSGVTETAVIHEDPNGEADLIRGGYVNLTEGARVAYSWQNWRRRWEVVKVGGRWRYEPGHGWAVLIQPGG